MKRIRNKSNKPLRISLPQGKVLHLGLNKTGEIAANAVEHPGVQRLVESGEIEILGEGEHEFAGGDRGEHLHESTHGHHAEKTVHIKGNRGS